jgi:hypothetical protein
MQRLQDVLAGDFGFDLTGWTLRLAPEGVSDHGMVVVGTGVNPQGRLRGWIANLAGNGAPACSNTLDDDADGPADYPADPGCFSALDEDERSLTVRRRPRQRRRRDDRLGRVRGNAGSGLPGRSSPHARAEVPPLQPRLRAGAPAASARRAVERAARRRLAPVFRGYGGPRIAERRQVTGPRRRGRVPDPHAAPAARGDQTISISSARRHRTRYSATRLPSAARLRI